MRQVKDSHTNTGSTVMHELNCRSSIMNFQRFINELVDPSQTAEKKIFPNVPCLKQVQIDRYTTSFLWQETSRKLLTYIPLNQRNHQSFVFISYNYIVLHKDKSQLQLHLSPPKKDLGSKHMYLVILFNPTGTDLKKSLKCVCLHWDWNSQFSTHFIDHQDTPLGAIIFFCIILA